MLGDLLKKIKNSPFGGPRIQEIDSSQFNDPVAQKCSWEPLKSATANFNTHKLQKVGDKALTYKPTPMMLIMGIAFVAVGVGVLAAYAFGAIAHWMALVMALLFSCAGVIIFLQGTTPMTFDIKSKTFCRGRSQKQCTSFDRIHGIQILVKIGKVNNNSDNIQRVSYFYAYEINLVLHDGNRVYVMAYTNKDKALNDAGLIADLVHVPIWDGTESCSVENASFI